MNNDDVLQAYLGACRKIGLDSVSPDQNTLAPATLLPIPAAQWDSAAQVAKDQGLRWCALWAEEKAPGYRVLACLEAGGQYLILRTDVPADVPLASHAPYYCAADRPERHAHDLLGILFRDQPDNRRWTRHRAWRDNEFPLRGDFEPPSAPPPTPSDNSYPFVQAQGTGVIEIPVGPIHASAIEPGHFRFQAVGETVLNLEQRLGYVHKGIEKIAVGRDAAGLARLAARVSGDSTVAHSWAACQAMERAIGLDLPPRVLWLRALLAERERVANHLGDVGGICNDVGFAFAQYQCSRLREQILRENADVFGHRLLMDCVIAGGVANDLTADAARRMANSARAIASEVTALVDTLEGSESLEDRLMATGRLEPDLAAALGTLGYVGKAAGQPFDVRRDAPYPPYDGLDVRVPCYRAGDVAARAKIRTDEIGISLGLVGQLLDSLPAGPYRIAWQTPDNACEGIGFVEGWRGEIMSYVRFDHQGRVARFFPRDPSWLNWPALELLIQGNIVPDFPVCNKSVNGSYSGHDL